MEKSEKGLTSMLNTIVLSSHKTEVQKGQRETHMSHVLKKVKTKVLEEHLRAIKWFITVCSVIAEQNWQSNVLSLTYELYLKLPYKYEAKIRTFPEKKNPVDLAATKCSK